MTRNLITQIKNEWRDNIWLVVELMIVILAIWALSCFLGRTLSPKFEDTGCDIEDVYRISVRPVPSDSPDYVDLGELKAEGMMADMQSLVARIRKSPNVEVAALSNNALPYQLSYMGNVLRVVGSEDSVPYYFNLRMASPEIVRVLKLRSADGTSPALLEASLRKGEMLISTDPWSYDRVRDSRKLVGSRAMLLDTVTPVRVGGIINAMKRKEYEYMQATVFYPIDESGSGILWGGEIAVRVKPGKGEAFEMEFAGTPEMRRMRNMYLTGLVDMRDVRKSCQFSNDNETRLMCAGIVFLLIIIFLGLLGTFWFRVQQRVGEIALRKTCGATSGDIFRRVISEGLLLLVAAAVPAAGIAAWINSRNEISVMSVLGVGDMWVAGLIHFVIALSLMVLMIVLGILFPARKAMGIEPAIALKEE